MVKLFSVAEMQSLEKEANQGGLVYEMMMENAGRGIAKEIISAYSHLHNKKVIALIGSGNNGGDTLISLAYLANDNWETFAYIVRKRPEHDPLIARLKENHGQVINLDDDNDFLQLTNLIDTGSILIDGILGTGIKLPLNKEISNILSFINSKQAVIDKKIHVVAVDCPTGVDCDTGNVAPEIIPAELTITMAGLKIGLIKFPAASYVGKIRDVSIGPIENLQAYTQNNKVILSGELVKKFLPNRPLDAHKGTFGTVFIAAGSVNFTGAALLSGLAAYKIGVGLVTMAVPEPLHVAISGCFPEATWLLLPHELGVISAGGAKIIRKNISHATALLLGPGLGLEDTTKEFIRGLLTKRINHEMSMGFIHDEKNNNDHVSIKIPMVVDADGLKLIAKIDHWPRLLPPATVLTPHPGEMAILTGLTIESIQNNRLDIVKEFSEKWGLVVVLKGAFTVIADPSGQTAIVPVATPALAKAGTGDVLAGLIVGLLAQNGDAYQAACCGAWIHANAGLLAAKILGNNASVLASDVLNAIPQVLSDIQ